MSKFVDPNSEKKLLTYFLKEDRFLLDVPSKLFSEVSVREGFKFLKSHYEKYQELPTKKSILKADLSSETIIVLLESYKQSKQLQPRGYKETVIGLWDLYVRRNLYSIAESLAETLDSKETSDLIRGVTSKIADLTAHPFSTGGIQRGLIWKQAAKRWDEFKLYRGHTRKRHLTSSHIIRLDEALNGGFKASAMTLFFSLPGNGKTRIMLNIGYNIANYGKKPVMFLAREMDFETINLCYNSREAMLDFNAIYNAKLSDTEAKQYAQVLERQYYHEAPFYLVDIPFESSTAHVISELELYHAKFGTYPEILIIDYANLMYPLKPYSNTSERYGQLFTEWHDLARRYKLHLITAVQESRPGAMTKDLEKKGQEHIGLSHYIAPNVETIIHLHKDHVDEIENILHCSMKKNRYGSDMKSFTLFVDWARNYIGDREIQLIEGKKPKEKKVDTR